MFKKNSVFTLLFLFLLIANPSYALLVGDLHPNFGDQGSAVIDVSNGGDDLPYGIGKLSDGKLIVAGQTDKDDDGIVPRMFLLRLLSDGQIDSSFGTNGRKIYDFDFGHGGNQHSISVYDLVIGNDDSIYVTGQVDLISSVTVFVAKFDANGNLDASFGLDSDNDGTLDGITYIPNIFAEAHGIALQGDGKVVVAGHGISNPGIQFHTDYFVARFNTDGSIDTSFNSTGYVFRDQSDVSNQLFDVAIQNDGKIVVVGQSDSQGAYGQAAMRFHSDGSIDLTFSQGLCGNTYNGLYSVLPVTKAGITKILMAGWTRVNSWQGVTSYSIDNFRLERFHANGSNDTSFGEDYNNDGTKDGCVATDFQPNTPYEMNYAYEIFFNRSSIKTTVVGFYNKHEVILARYDKDGKLDPTFHSDGYLSQKLFTTYSATREISAVMDDNEHIITVTDNGEDVVVSKFLGKLTDSDGDGLYAEVDDCDDANPNIQGRQTYYDDTDQDGLGNPDSSIQECTQPDGYVSNADDCDDTDAGIGGEVTFYYDADHDGYGNPNWTKNACSAPEGYVDNSDDCYDYDDSINPGETEVCDGKDNDCNSQKDDGLEVQTYYEDADNDTYGNLNSTTTDCTQPSGYVTNSDDCNDTDANITPAIKAYRWFYPDQDEDGYGFDSPILEDERYACDAPAQYAYPYVDNKDDCNDFDADHNPGAIEVCDGKDNNCDGSTDEGVKNTYYQDSDSDNYGNASVTTEACSAPTDYVTDNSDCNDNDSNINPGATEVCDGADNNCDGSIDEGIATQTYYQDSDSDGFGNASVMQIQCSQPTGYVTDSSDCSDSDASINPSATEVCGDNIDQDCDGSDLICPVEETPEENTSENADSGDSGSDSGNEGTDDSTDFGDGGGNEDTSDHTNSGDTSHHTENNAAESDNDDTESSQTSTQTGESSQDQTDESTQETENTSQESLEETSSDELPQDNNDTDEPLIDDTEESSDDHATGSEQNQDQEETLPPTESEGETTADQVADASSGGVASGCSLVVTQSSAGMPSHLMIFCIMGNILLFLRRLTHQSHH